MTFHVLSILLGLALQVGTVEFPSSATPAAQSEFLRGVAILHSFGFEDAIEAFQKAQALEPDFALAYWGEAMAHNRNPLSSPTEQNLPEARKALSKLGRTREERIAKAKTEREKMWMEAVEILYGAGDKEARDWAYAAAMEQIAARYPQDLEARAFYALALLGTVRRAGNDFRQQMKAAAVAEEIFREHPAHPGAAHYIIHAFDDPLHAPLALYAADRYGEIAPDVEHALHMPSHIYVQLGLWEKTVMSNRRAYQASVAWVSSKGLSETKRDFHALAWMEYGYLQRGELSKARETIEEIRPIAEREVTTDRIKATFSNMKARYMLEAGEWDRYPIPVQDLLKQRYAGDLYLLLAAGFKAVNQGDLATAERIERRLAELEGQETQGLKSYFQGQVTLEDLKVSTTVAHRELAALIRLTKGEHQYAVRLMGEAMEKETGMHPAYGPPEPIVPPYELYGYVLLESGRPEEALSVFEEMLVRMPNRALSILGAARSAGKLGRREVAARHYQALRTMWSEGERTRRLEEAERFLGETSSGDHD
jgi:tetratricopeptide (TPR) repeat protein